MPPKARHADLHGRIREVISDPNNARIPRVPNAGHVVKHRGYNCIVSHTGLLLEEESSYGDYGKVMIYNRGVHEAQEEYVFGKALDVLDGTAPMVELGSHWAYYSLMYKQRFPSAATYMMEPEASRLARGELNFDLNDMQGTEFKVGGIRQDGVNMTTFCANRGIEDIGILHADIQGAEMRLLHENNEIFAKRIPQFVFISTHSQKIHIVCRDKLKAFGYRIVADADFNNDTFSLDGLLVACRAHIDFGWIDVFSRSQL